MVTGKLNVRGAELPESDGESMENTPGGLEYIVTEASPNTEELRNVPL